MLPKTPLSALKTEFLFDLAAELAGFDDVGVTPSGARRVRYLKGGTFAGPRLSGTVLPGGGDWILVRGDGSRQLDVRLTLRTAEGHLIYVESRGLLLIAPEDYQRVFAGETVDPSRYYFRTTPRFETASPDLAWINRLVAVTVGRVTATTVYQTVYAVL